MKGTKAPTCLHDGGRHADDSWGGCLLTTHEKCDVNKCEDYTVPQDPRPGDPDDPPHEPLPGK